MNKKFEARVTRLANKIGMSQTPVPGFIMGLSGTDSVVAFIMCYDALKRHDKAHRLLGINYINGPNQRDRWFASYVIPWLQERCPEANIEVQVPMGGNHDQQRWADLHVRALNRIDHEGRLHALDEENTYWVVGTINATEKHLGKYSVMATAVSVQPLMTLYKSDIIKICVDLGVPQIAINKSRLPDCLCGRDEKAASNIELIDDILRFNVSPSDHDPLLLAEMYIWVRDCINSYGFKSRIPYVI